MNCKISEGNISIQLKNTYIGSTYVLDTLLYKQEISEINEVIYYEKIYQISYGIEV
jgi:hypothetical protein